MKKSPEFRTLKAFSLVEVVLAIGVLAFALVSIVALLPMGLKSNRISAEESRAVNLLTAVEADLRGSVANGSSQIYQLPTPYKTNATPPVVFHAPTVGTAHTRGVQDDEIPAAAAAGLRYQVSVIYTKVPAAGSLLPMEARLVVNWPCLSPADSTPVNLTGSPKVAGFIESYVTFPAP